MNSRIFITTDTHWFWNMEKFGRPNNHTEQSINMLCYYLKQNDILVHLGDIMHEGHRNQLKAIMSMIAGKKVLVRGNHDKQTNNWYLNNGFDFVCDQFITRKIVFSHKPIPKIQDTDMCIHGHFHANPRERWEKELLDIYDDNYHKLLVLEDGYSPWRLDNKTLKRMSPVNTKI